MKIERLIYICFIIVFRVENVFGVCTVAAPAEMTNGVVKIVTVGELHAYWCNTGFKLSIPDVSVVVSRCYNEIWTALTATCVADASYTIPTCTGEPQTLPDGALVSLNEPPIRAYACPTGQAWITSQSLRIVQCLSGNSWSEIADICDEECQVPRECHGVALLNLVDSDVNYNVIATGHPDGVVKSVRCREIESTNDGHWTLVYIRQGQPGSGNSVQDYINGYGTSDSNYFVGLAYEAALTDNDTFTLSIQMNSSSGQVYHATFSNFRVGAMPHYKLESIGEYHGNAGDALCPHVGAAFAFGAAGNGSWWGGTSQEGVIEGISGAFPDNLFWGTLNVTDISKIIMHIRPNEYDTTINCPPHFGYEPSWTHTVTNISADRHVGVIFTWSCEGEYYMAGPEAGPFNTHGVVECISSNNGPTWSVSDIYWPCRLICPSGFILSKDQTVCYLISTEEAANIVDAGIKCLERNASLAGMLNLADMETAVAGVNYLTGHAKRGKSQTSLEPPFPITDQEYTCETATGIPSTPLDATCSDTDKSKSCVVINKEVQYAYSNCDAPSKYICQIPGACPSKYEEIKGGCYRTIDGDELMPALEKCEDEGSSLAYPTNLERVQLIYDYMRSIPINEVALGLNYVDKTWTAGGIYTNVNVTLIASIIRPDMQTYVKLISNTSGTAVSHSLTAFRYDDFGAEKYLCQYHGPIGCHSEPPNNETTMVRNWDNSTTTFSDVTYSCLPGYFVNGIIPDVKQTLYCTSLLGEWNAENLYQPCIRVEVCANSSVTDDPAITNATDSETFYLNGNITFKCPTGLSMNIIGAVTQETTAKCNEISTGVYGFQPASIDCNVCNDSISLANASSNQIETPPYTVGMHVDVTCKTGHEFAFGETVQAVTCLAETGWDSSSLQECYQVCNMTVANTDNAVLGPITANTIGSQRTLECNEGYYFKITEARRDITNVSNYVCNGAAQWENPKDEDHLICEMLCIADPFAAPATVISSWDNFKRTIDTKVNYTCADEGFLFEDFSMIHETTCNGSHWSPINGSILSCRQVCNSSSIQGDWAISNNATTNYSWVGVTVNSSCPQGEANLPGKEISGELTCSNNGSWSPSIANFNCEPVCFDDPPSTNGGLSYNFTNNNSEGAVVEYLCAGNFSSGDDAVYSECKNGSWSLTSLPTCVQTLEPTTTENTTSETTTEQPSTTTTETPTTTPTTTKATIVVLDPALVEVEYSNTASEHMPNLNEEMASLNGEPIKQVNGPLGFGTANELHSEDKECLKKILPVSKDSCLSNPKDCPNGFTFGMYIKYHQDEESGTDLTGVHKYFVSTGGNVLGTVGIAMYQDGKWLGGVVSLGLSYWKVEVYGQLVNGSWYHIALAFEKPNGNNIDSAGVMLYVDGVQKGWAINSMGSSATSETVPAVPELLIGCVKNKDGIYEGFNDAVVDEFVIWDPRLAARSALGPNITDLLLGGYKKEYEGASAAEMNHLADKVMMKDDGQFSGFGKILYGTLESAFPDTNTASTTANSVSSTSGGPASTASSSPPTEDDKMLGTVLDTFKKFLDPKNLRDHLSNQICSEKMVGAMYTKQILHAGMAERWQRLQMRDASKSPSYVNELLSEYLLELGLRCDIPEDKKEHCEYQESAVMVIQMCTMKIKDLKSHSNFEFPRYDKITDELLEEWDMPYDRASFATHCFKDERCDERKVTFVSIFYRDYHLLTTTSTHQGRMEDGFEFDSKVVTFRERTALAKIPEGQEGENQIDKSEPLCVPDEDCMMRNRIVSKHKHLEKIKSFGREPLAWLDETESEILYRTCVQWNSNLSEPGSWSNLYCNVHKTKEDYTICVCKGFGTVTVMKLKYEKPIVEDSPQWLVILGYVAAGLSAFLLCLYIFVVLISDDLKDQFHLMGLNLAVVTLLAITTTMLREILPIPDNDRKLCVTFSTLTQFFNLAIGTWICALAHGSFRAITAGVISGKLKPYSAMSWGLALALIGPPFIGYGEVFCSIYEDNERLLTFFIPQLAFGAAALFYAFVIFCNLSAPALRKDNLIEDYGSFARGSALLQIYFTVVFVFGFLSYFEFEGVDFYPPSIILYYFFGTVLFIFIGLGSNRFRIVLAGQAKKRRLKVKHFAFGLPGASSKETTNPAGSR